MHVAAVTRYGEGHNIDVSYLWLGGDGNLFKYLRFPFPRSELVAFSPLSHEILSFVGIASRSANAGTGTSPRDL